MRIETGIPRLRPVSGRTSATSASFTPTAGSTPARATGGAAPAAYVGGLFGVAPEDDATARRSRGVAQAESMLEDLDALHAGIIAGRIPRARLEAMSTRLAAAETPDDPRLAAITSDIELRLAVELAKLAA
jgi:hypothetical protein